MVYVGNDMKTMTMTLTLTLQLFFSFLKAWGHKQATFEGDFVKQFLTKHGVLIAIHVKGANHHIFLYKKCGSDVVSKPFRANFHIGIDVYNWFLNLPDLIDLDTVIRSITQHCPVISQCRVSLNKTWLIPTFSHEDAIPPHSSVFGLSEIHGVLPIESRMVETCIKHSFSSTHSSLAGVSVTVINKCF